LARSSQAPRKSASSQRFTISRHWQIEAQVCHRFPRIHAEKSQESGKPSRLEKSYISLLFGDAGSTFNLAGKYQNGALTTPGVPVGSAKSLPGTLPVMNATHGSVTVTASRPK
jgi:hypothetical protein